MTLAPYVRILGVGPGRSRSLTQDEAQAAMSIILSGEAEPEAVGALLMLMRYRGETADEVAGFVQALRQGMPEWASIGAHLDWPSYAAGRTRGHPWFLLSAKLVAQAGVPVLLHGWNSHQNPIASVRDALPGLGIGVAETATEAAQHLREGKICYAPLEVLSPEALGLLRLRDKLGLRSIVNTCLRMLNPAGASATVQGVFHPSYRGLQSDAAGLIGQGNQLVIKGAGGEFERVPNKDVTLFGLRDGQPFTETAPALCGEVFRLSEIGSYPVSLWSGTTSDPEAIACVTGTAALALLIAGQAPDLVTAQLAADALWTRRTCAISA